MLKRYFHIPSPQCTAGVYTHIHLLRTSLQTHPPSPAHTLCPHPWHPPGACTCLAQHPGLAHKDQNVGSQNGQAEVQQDDGAFRFYEPDRAQWTGQRYWLPAWPAAAGHLPPCPTSNLPPKGSIDCKQREQGHAGHGTANHQGDRGGTRQLQGLQEMGFWERARQGAQSPCLV